MSNGFYGTIEDYQALYREKNEHLDKFLEQIEPFEFYREIFPEGTFERDGHLEDHKPNGIALNIDGDGNVSRYIITDDLKALEAVKETDFTIMAPVSYFGRKRSGKFARFYYAMVFDLDGVGMPQLRDVLHQMDKDILPKATFVVNSGTGLHLYYVLKEPVPMYPQNQHYLKELKFSLTRQIWNRFTSSIEKPQMQGILQAFRVVGSGTKLGKGFPVMAFQFGDRVELDDLLDFIPDTNGERQMLQGILRKGRISLSEAKEKYPDWYDRRIVKGEQRGHWFAKRSLYDWWLRRIRAEIRVGHRYHGVMTLAIYAKKCGISEKELRKDAYSLLEPYDAMSVEAINRFTKDDVEAALSMFNEDYMTFPRDDIARLTGMSMPVNKRNWRKQAQHLRLARGQLAILREMGEVKVGRPVGSGTARKTVYCWRQRHPEGRKADCRRDTGLDPKTIRKWWDSPAE